MSRRIHFVINSLSRGGAERVFIDDASFFASKGHVVVLHVLFSLGPLSTELKAKHIEVNELHAKSFYDLRALFRFRKMLHENDIVLSTLNESNAFARLAVLFTPNILLFTREANMQYAKGWKYRVLDWCFGLRSTYVVCVSEAVRQSLLSFVPWLRSRSVVVRNAVAVPVTKPELQKGTKLLTVGSLTVKKNHKILLEALALLPESYTLTIVGTGVLETLLKEQALSLGIIERVIFAGALSYEDVVREYRSHNLFVLPSLYEGCPNVILESQALALPTVAFNVPGIREVIDETSGVIVHEVTPIKLAEGIQYAHEHFSVLSDGAYKKAVNEYSKEMRQELLSNLLFVNKR